MGWKKWPGWLRGSAVLLVYSILTIPTGFLYEYFNFPSVLLAYTFGLKGIWWLIGVFLSNFIIGGVLGDIIWRISGRSDRFDMPVIILYILFVSLSIFVIVANLGAIEKAFGLCEAITTQRTRDRCWINLAGKKNDLSLCERIIDIQERGVCYLNIASIRNDLSICDKIEHVSQKKFCKNHFNKLKKMNV
ncbi:MAG: hypothetical protein AABW90_01555 [Nanoarchaeota archaeon]